MANTKISHLVEHNFYKKGNILYNKSSKVKRCFYMISIISIIVVYFVKLHDLLVSGVFAVITGIWIYFSSVSQMEAHPDISLAVGMSMMIFPMIVAFIVLAILRLIRIIEYWRIFKHENIPVWKALIPFYCDYTLCKITDTDVKWSFLEFTPIISFLTMTITYQAPDPLQSLNDTTTNGHYSPILYVVIITLILGKIVYSYVLAKNTSKKFEKPNSFTWKLFFLPIIYYMKVVSNKKVKKEIDYSNQFTPNINKIIENNKKLSTTPKENNNSLGSNINKNPDFSKEENDLKNEKQEVDSKDSTVVIPIENTKPSTSDSTQTNTKLPSNNNSTSNENNINLSDLYK